jgi:hypothetical protein
MYSFKLAWMRTHAYLGHDSVAAVMVYDSDVLGLMDCFLDTCTACLVMIDGLAADTRPRHSVLTSMWKCYVTMIGACLLCRALGQPLQYNHLTIVQALSSMVQTRHSITLSMMQATASSHSHPPLSICWPNCCLCTSGQQLCAASGPAASLMQKA